MINATRLKCNKQCNAANSLCCISVAWDGWSGSVTALATSVLSYKDNYFKNYF